MTESPTVSSFRRAVLDGNWAGAADGLATLGIDTADLPVGTGMVVGPVEHRLTSAVNYINARWSSSPWGNNSFWSCWSRGT